MGILARDRGAKLALHEGHWFNYTFASFCALRIKALNSPRLLHSFSPGKFSNYPSFTETELVLC